MLDEDDGRNYFFLSTSGRSRALFFWLEMYVGLLSSDVLVFRSICFLQDVVPIATNYQLGGPPYQVERTTFWAETFKRSVATSAYTCSPRCSWLFSGCGVRELVVVDGGGEDTGTMALLGRLGRWKDSHGMCFRKGETAGVFSVGVTGSSVEQQYRTAVFGAQKCARNSFNVTTSVRRGFLHDARAGAPWGGVGG